MTYLVTGATGNIGRRVATALHAAGQPVRAAARDHAEIAISGAERVDLDLVDPAGAQQVLEGVTAIFLYPTFEGPPTKFLQQARDSGAEYVVLLSSPDAYEAAPGTPIREAHRVIEEAVTESGIPHTTVYPSWLATNALRDWGEQIRTGRVGLVHPDAGVNPIHLDDIADVVVELLVGRRYPGTMLTMTGPESLTQREIVAILADELGRDLTIDQLTEQQAVDRREPWMPEAVLRTLIAHEGSQVGVLAPVSNAIERITGHPPRTFRRWVAEHQEAYA